MSKIQKKTKTAKKSRITDKIASVIVNDAILLASGIRYCVYNNKYVVIEGHRGLIEYKETYILLKGIDLPVKVNGFNLKIKQLTGELAILEGDITSVEGNFEV